MISSVLAFAAGAALAILIARGRLLALQSELAALKADQSILRHDIRGILSPALLVADRLVGHETPYVNRAGEVMIKTVERAAERLAQPVSKPRP